MKKSFLLLSIAAGISVFLTGCASTNFSISESGPFAIMSVSSNISVPYYSDETRDDEYGTEEGLLGNALTKFLEKNNPEILTALDRVDLCDSEIKRLMEENAGVSFIEKETVLDCEHYRKLMEGLTGYTDVYLRADGYKSIDSIGSKNARLIMSETGAKNLIFAHFVFKKKIVKGSKLSGDICAYASANFSVYDEKGKMILSDDFEVTSLETVHISMLDYDKDALVEMFPDLIDQLINQFIVKYF